MLEIAYDDRPELSPLVVELDLLALALAHARNEQERAVMLDAIRRPAKRAGKCLEFDLLLSDDARFEMQNIWLF